MNKPKCFHEERFWALWDDVTPHRWVCYHCAYDTAIAALKRIKIEGIDTSTEGGMGFVNDALKELGEE